MADENAKRVDESWKEKAQKEAIEPLSPEHDKQPVADFNFFVTTLAMQAWIALGAMANPATQKTEKNPEQAKLIIDTLEMMQVKTQGNLTVEESKFLEDVLYELRMGFINDQQKINL